MSTQRDAWSVSWVDKVEEFYGNVYPRGCVECAMGRQCPKKSVKQTTYARYRRLPQRK